MKSKNIRDSMSSLEARGVIEHRVSEGRVPAYAIDEINVSLTGAQHTTLPADFDTRWVVQDGEFRGKFPKRVAQYIRRHGREDESVDSYLLSQVGNIARQSAPPDDVIYVDISTDLDWKAGDYGDDGSCFWGCKQTARFSLMYLKSYAIRFYDRVSVERVRDTQSNLGCSTSRDGRYYRQIEDTTYLVEPSTRLKDEIYDINERGENGYDSITPGRLVMQGDDFFCGIGRAWILMDVPSEDDALTFNMYHILGDYRLRHAAHILSELLDKGGVQMVNYFNYDGSEGDLWINNATGALVTSIEKLEVRSRGQRRRRVNTTIDCNDLWQCSLCRKVEQSNYDNNARHINYKTVCQACFEANCVECETCGENIDSQQVLKTYAFEKVLDWTFVKIHIKNVCPNCSGQNASLCNGINVRGTDNQGQRRSCETLIDNDYLSKSGDAISCSFPVRTGSTNVCPVCAADSVKNNYCVFCGRLEYEARNDRFAEYVVGGVHVRMCGQCFYGQNTLHALLGKTVFFADFDEHPDAFGLVEAQNHCDRKREQLLDAIDKKQRRIEESWTTSTPSVTVDWKSIAVMMGEDDE